MAGFASVPSRGAMKLVVFGATGGTGRELVAQALASGCSVTAVARRPEAVGTAHGRLNVIAGDVREPDGWADALQADVAVLSALGVGSARSPGGLFSEGVATIVSAMRDRGARRLVAVSAAPVAPDAEKTALDRRLLHPVIGRIFGAVYEDMTRMEAHLASSPLEWTAFRPPRLTDGRATGRFRTAVGEPLPRARSIPRADLATAMLAAVGDRSLVGRAVAIAA